MNRSLSMAMVAAIALTAGLAVVFGDIDRSNHFAYAPAFESTDHLLADGGATGLHKTSDLEDDELPDDIMAILELEFHAPESTTTTSSTTTTTTPAPSTTQAASSPSTTRPSPAPTTTRPAGSVRSNLEVQFFSLINEYRASHGLAPLTRSSALNTTARDWSMSMADRGELSHSNLRALIPPWSAVAENVGYGGSVTRLFQAFVDSPGHESNLRGNYTHVGIGVWQTPNGTIWTTHIFTR